MDLCFQGNAVAVRPDDTFNADPASPYQPATVLKAFNLQSIVTDGFDIEASYQTDGWTDESDRRIPTAA